MNLAEGLLSSSPLEDLTSADFTEPYNINSKEAILCLEEWGDNDMTSYTELLPSLIEKYDAVNDLRFNLYFTSKNDKYVPTKGGPNSNYKVSIRSSEIYLIAAEAAAHVDGKLDQAKDRLKELIKVRLQPDYYEERAAEIDQMTAEELLVEIANERARELALEGGHRWFDLRRTDRPEIVKVYTTDQGKQDRQVLSKDDSRYTIAFPKEATESNPNLHN